jgi:pilus assembly protein Flp/PilA
MIRAPLLVRRLAALLVDRRGATVVEYGLICALIVLVMLVSLKSVASITIGMWNNVSTTIVASTQRP